MIRNLFEEGIFNRIDDRLAPNEQPNHFTNNEEVNKKTEAELAAAQAKANQLIAEAEQEARNLLKQVEVARQSAVEEIEVLKAEAKKQGYEAGYVEGQNEGFRAYNKLIEQAHSVIVQSEKDYERTIESADPVIIEVACALTKRMIDLQLEGNSHVWGALLRQVITEVREHEKVRIFVHPDWFEYTTNQKEELEQLLSHTENLFIYPDAGLMKHGCVIETKYGRIEATVDKQLEVLKAQLLEMVQEGIYES